MTDLPDPQTLGNGRYTDIKQGDPKYGRLYTSADVNKIVHWLTNGTAEGIEDADYADVVADQVHKSGVPMTFPADEPLFLVRGQDRFALDAVDAYAMACEEVVDEAHKQSIGRTTMAIRTFQNEHPDRVKTPDS